MADSNITKKALATALKELMQEKRFEKISVGDICEKCDMNRKSFYYHFKDKYDLVNWIFDTEFIAVAGKQTYDDVWALLMDMCQMFYDNRNFYCKALSIKGQNSFTDHFRDFLCDVVVKSMQAMLKVENISQFQATFFADAFVLAVQRWIMDPKGMPSEEFVQQIQMCII